MKACARCEKTSADFSPDRRASDGLQPSCRPCNRAAKKKAREANIDAFRVREREYYRQNMDKMRASAARSALKNRDKVLAGKRAYYERVKKTPEYIAKSAAYMEATKDKKREYDKQYRAARPGLCAARAKGWVAANPEKRRAIANSYKSRRKTQEESGIESSVLANWIENQPKVCFYCGCDCPESFHVDHFIPLSKGGAHVLPNLRIACGTCNVRKSAKLPDVWMAERERAAA